MSGASGLRKHGHTSAGDGGTITVPGGDAVDVVYDPTASGLTATDVQAAIDELDATLDGLAGVDIADDAALIQGVNFEDQAGDPAAPAAGHHVIYAKAGGVYIEDDASAVVGPLGTGSVPQALDVGDSPQFLAVNVGHASDTTLARASAGNLTVEGNALYRAGGTDVPIADGGTGASTQAAAFDALSPMTTAGDIIIGGTAGTGTRLAAGTATHVLTSNGAGVAPSYQAVAGTGTVTTVKDEGSNLSTAVTSIDFVGAGVTATGTTAVTVTIPGGSGSVATDAIFDAKGDLPVGTGADTAAKLTVGANGTRPEAASGETTGIKWSLPPGYEFDYATKTSDTSITATTEATADTVVTGNAVAYDGATVVVVVFGSPALILPGAASSNFLVIDLYDGSSAVGQMAVYLGDNSTGGRAGGTWSYRLTPSNASHTYSIRAHVGNGTGTVQGGAGGSGAVTPAFIRITKV